MSLLPRLVLADSQGRIFDHPRLLMSGRRGNMACVPMDGDLLPLPAESELFLLPGREPVGFNPRTNDFENCSGQAVAAFAAPGHTLSAHPFYWELDVAPVLPFFAYGAVAYARGKFWLWASRTDNDRRQVFKNIPYGKICSGARMLRAKFPANRLIAHIVDNCVFRYGCPAAKNFALGRYEAPLPTSRACNAHCLGCISASQPDSPPTPTPQCRLDFVPDAAEIAQVMAIHEKREKARPIYSFGQGCEGDPLLNAPLLAESIRIFRSWPGGGGGTVNCNSNASRPEAVALLAGAGLSSLRISLNSARPEHYMAYYNPSDYDFTQVEESARIARRKGIFVSLNLLWFPGLTDCNAELTALASFCRKNGVSMIQWRNLNIDPHWYLRHMRERGLVNDDQDSQPMGLNLFMRRLKEMCPWLRFGYFNPWLGARASIIAPEV